MRQAGEFPHFGNVSPFQNRVSSAALEERYLAARAPGLTVDTFHGHSWSYPLNPGDAAYGITEALAEGPLDAYANGAFLRVPYRRIPRIRIGSMQELHDFAKTVDSEAGSTSLMWRGQSELYTLRSRRTDEDLLKFYGSVDVVEPSLLPSASRAKIQIEHYQDAWFGLLDILINRLQERLRFELGAAIADELALDASVMRQSYGFREWAFGVAQHYGLPSTGLDVTPDINVAAFFALHEFATEPNGLTSVARLPSTAKPVVYLMSIFEGDLRSDEATSPAHLVTPRAKAQKAHFFRTAWGSALNRAAERIVVVLDFVDNTKWKLPISESELFPKINLDPFAAFLKDAQVSFPEIMDTVPLRRVYFTA